MSESTPTKWYTITLTGKQLWFMELLCKFHLSESNNEYAKDRTRKLLWCLEHWKKCV